MGFAMKPSKPAESNPTPPAAGGEKATRNDGTGQTGPNGPAKPGEGSSNEATKPGRPTAPALPVAARETVLAPIAAEASVEASI